VSVSSHAAVLEEQAVEGLRVRSGGCYVDCTFGRGGHSRRILAGLGRGGRLLALDRDPHAVAAGGEIDDGRFSILHGQFSRLGELAASAGIARADGILLDLGVSSPQLDDPARGFSFRHDAPLDMRMDPGAGTSAAEWLARASESEIADVLYTYGEERQSRRIARAIVARRAQQPITRTAELAELIASVMPRGAEKIHPATRSFQAIRIHVNRELADLESGLDAALSALKPAGRLAVISFHSLEDRIVKRFIARHAKAPAANRRLPEAQPFVPTLAAIGDAQKAGADETAANPRARSAVLRVAEKLGGAA
jgi:16S rRNA (cytosine1402-N4)-methyltransferase